MGPFLYSSSFGCSVSLGIITKCISVTLLFCESDKHHNYALG